MNHKRNIYKKNDKVKRKSVFFSFKKPSALVKRLIKFFFASLVLAATLLLLVTIFYAVTLPDVNNFFEIKKNRHITLIDESGDIVAGQGDIRSNYIAYEDLPPHLIDALIATEDRRFFDHWGVDVFGLARAFYKNTLAGGKVQGGSTITQQLAKIAFLGPQKTIKRKLQEFLLALYLEHRFDKKQIITAYLNRVYLGSGVFGIDAAAKFYFDKEPKNLNLLESAILVGMLKAPSKYSPIFNNNLSGKRAYQILLNMEDAGYISKSQMNAALSERVVLKTNKALFKTSYFAGYIFDQVNSLFPDTGIDLIVKVAVNQHLQDFTQNLIKKYVDKYGKANNFSQGAALVIDSNGKIITMVGGTDYTKSPFNRAYQSKRLAGSAFKPIVYIDALIQGYTPDSKMSDKPIKYGNWQPKNNSKKFYGQVTLREAFARSLNTIPIQLVEKLGVQSVISVAEEMGITSPQPENLTIALGTGEVSMLELATAYFVITNNGYLIEPYGIIEVKDKEHNLLYSKNIDSYKILNKEVSSEIKSLMISAVTDGSGKNAFIPNAMIGGKTGTSQDFRDAWFIGFMGGYTIAIWLGNDDNSPMKNVGGSSFPALIFKDIALHIE